MKERKKEHFSKSVGYLLLSQCLIKICGLIYSLYLINKEKFGDEGNAIYLSGYQFFSLLLTFSAIGVPNSVSNLIAQYEDYYTVNKVFKTAIFTYSIFAIIGMLFLFMFSNIISRFFLGIECVSYNLKLLAPGLLFSSMECVFLGFFNGIKQMKITAKIQFIEQVAKTIITIVFVELLSKINPKPELLSIGATLGVTFSIFIGFIVCFFEKNKIQIKGRLLNNNDITYKTILKKLLIFSIPISIGAMLVSINKNIDSFSVMKIISVKIGVEEAKRIYGIIASKIDVLILLPLAFNMTFSTALIPNISEANKNKDYKLIKRLCKKGIYMSLVIGIGSTIGLLLFSKNIFDLLFSGARNGEKMLKIASFSVIFAVLNQTFCGILQGLQKNKNPVLASIIGTISKVLFNLILVKKDYFLENGIIISTIISNIIMFIYLYYCVKKEIKINIEKDFFIVFLIAIIMVGIIVIFNYLLNVTMSNEKISFVVSAFLGGIFYLSITQYINGFEGKSLD